MPTVILNVKPDKYIYASLGNALEDTHVIREIIKLNFLYIDAKVGTRAKVVSFTYSDN